MAHDQPAMKINIQRLIWMVSVEDALRMRMLAHYHVVLLGYIHPNYEFVSPHLQDFGFNWIQHV